MNAAIFTGARTTYAMGQDFAFFAKLGAWRASGSTPANALILQGAITLILIIASAVTPDGFSAMVAYTSPVFWTFFLLTALTLFVFRRRGGDAPFRVPLYPIVPIAFCGACVHAVLQHQLRAVCGGVRCGSVCRPGHHGARHSALLPRQKAMTLTELRYIVAVARERHFGRAAETCFVSQPTLSVAVKKLEDELGVTLFERGPGEVSVTPTGRVIIEQAQRVLEEALRIRELAAAGRTRSPGRCVSARSTPSVRTFCRS